jgi:4-amino-4-deoxy-L-arabinose transferase-like glycosyltransferase
MNNQQNSEDGFLKMLSLLSLVGLSISIFLGKSYLNTLQAMDSSVYARLALDATRNGFLPRLPIGHYMMGQGHWPEGFNDHPFTLIWINGWIMRALGPSTWSARLLPALLSVLCIFVIYLIGKKLYRSHAVGVVAGFIGLATPLFMSYGSRFHLDSAMLLGILISFYGWIASSQLATLAGTMFAVWVKGPLGFLLFPVVFISGFLSRSWDQARIKKFVLLSIFALILGGSIWIVIGFLGGFDLVTDYWKRFVMGQVLNRATVPTLPILSKIFLKWSLWSVLLGLAIFRYFKQKRYRDENFNLPLIAGFFILTLVSSMKFKYEHYYLPMFSFFALFIAGSFQGWIEKNATRLQRALLFLAILTPPVLLATPIDIGVEKFPQLRAMIPYIKSQGTCRDTLIFLEGSQPYGSIGDYAAVLQFYTNRHTIEARCDGLEEALTRTQAAWLLGSDELFKKCSTDATRNKYPSSIRFGSQVLWSRYPLTSHAQLDLTPLALPYTAISDCELPKLPKSRYFK